MRTALAIASIGWLIRADAAERSFLREQRAGIKKGQIIAAPVMIETLLANSRHLSGKAGANPRAAPAGHVPSAKAAAPCHTC